MQYFLLSFRAEILKVKRTFALWLTILGALFVPMIYFLIMLNRPAFFIPKDPAKENIWVKYYENAWQSTSFFLLPFFIILLTTLIVQIEHKSNTWKHLLTLPVPKWVIYINKLLIIVFLVMLCYLLFNIFLLIGAFVLGISNPRLTFHTQPIPMNFLVNYTIKSFVSTLGLTAIHYWIALRIKNLILPIGIGIVGVIAGLILINGWENIIYLPYAHSTMTYFKMSAGSFKMFETHEIHSLAWFVGIAILGFIDFKWGFRS